MILFSRQRISGRPGRDRIVVSTSRCGRDNPGSNPGHGKTTAKPTLFLAIRSMKISDGLRTVVCTSQPMKSKKSPTLLKILSPLL